MSKRERNALKGAIRRVFARSDLRREALERLPDVAHTDPLHPRVRRWAICPSCGATRPRYLFQVDHHVPIVPVNTTLEHMTWDNVINRMWCMPINLRPICKECHAKKTAIERKERAKFK